MSIQEGHETSCPLNQGEVRHVESYRRVRQPNHRHVPHNDATLNTKGSILDDASGGRNPGSGRRGRRKNTESLFTMNK